MALFTAETASEAAKRSHLPTSKRHLTNVFTPPEPTQPQPIPQPAAIPADYYVQGRLARVREQIERLSDMLDEETDPQKIDRICAGIERLSKIEGNLANRPLPGSRRPAPERDRRRDFGLSGLAQPVEPAPGLWSQHPNTECTRCRAS